jgi:hypothetical protein
MRFEVPQFIEIEDKIFGPFTWKQFVYLAGGVGLSVVILFTLPLILFILFGVPLAGLAVLLAFYPVNNRPFSNFLESMIFFYKNDRIYHWRKKANIIYKERGSGGEDRAYGFSVQPGMSNINSLSRRLELNAIQKEQ